MEGFFLNNRLLEVTQYYFCYMILITQTSPGKMWEGITYRCAYQEAGIIGAFSEAGHPFPLMGFQALWVLQLNVGVSRD